MNVLSEPVRLSIPATAADVRVARLTAAVVACMLDLDEIDDICVAVDELANALIEAHPVTDLHFVFANRSDAFVAEGTATVALPPHLSELARQVLGVVVDGYELTDRVGLAHFEATKRFSVASGSPR